MNKKYKIYLQKEERQRIEQLLHSNSTSKGIRNCCLILLLADEGQGAILRNAEIASRAGVSQAMNLLLRWRMFCKRMPYPMIRKSH